MNSLAATAVYGLDDPAGLNRTQRVRFTLLAELPARVTPPNGCPCWCAVLCKVLGGEQLPCEAGLRVQYEDGTEMVL